jgi:hypothetical protein
MCAVSEPHANPGSTGSKRPLRPCSRKQQLGYILSRTEKIFFFVLPANLSSQGV